MGELIELLNIYNKAINDCIHHNFLIDSLNAKLSKEFFILFQDIYKIVSDSKEQKTLLNSVKFLRNIESFATLTKRIIFATSTLDQSELDNYKHKIVDFYRKINYPIDLDNFIYDYSYDLEQNFKE